MSDRQNIKIKNGYSENVQHRLIRDDNRGLNKILLLLSHFVNYC
jgi:hypothetical protein